MARMLIILVSVMGIAAISASWADTMHDQSIIDRYLEERKQVLLQDERIQEMLSRGLLNDCTAEELAVVVATADFYAAQDALEVAEDALEDCQNQCGEDTTTTVADFLGKPTPAER